MAIKEYLTVPPIPESKLTQKDKESLLTEHYIDPVKFLKFYLPDQFPKEIPWVHRGILAIATRKTDFLLRYGELDKIFSHFTWKEDPDDPDSVEHPIFIPTYNEDGDIVRIDMEVTKYTELMMPRGSSKTTLMGLGVPLYKIVYGENNFIVYISETATAAALQMDAVKGELEGNDRLKFMFGDLVPDKQSTKKWTAEFFQTTTNIIVTCRGRGGQIRGLNVRGKRPDLVIVDDIENEESVKTDDQRLKTKNWFYKALLPCLDAMNDEAGIIALGTLLHRESLLMSLSRDPDWTSLLFGALDRDGDPLWPLYMDLKKYERVKLSYGRNGMLSAFYMEYMSQIRSAEEAKFKPEFFIVDPFILQELIASSQVIDPAISENEGSDYCAVVNAGITSKGLIGCIDTWYKIGAHPREQVDIFFEKSRLHKPTRHGVEAIAYQKALCFLLQEEMGRQNYFFVIEEIRHGNTAKDERISGILQPRYANYYIRHLRKFPMLETQLLDFPKGKKDLPDAFAMAVALLTPYAGAAIEVDDYTEEDSYEPLSVAMGGEWRTH